MSPVPVILGGSVDPPALRDAFPRSTLFLGVRESSLALSSPSPRHMNGIVFIELGETRVGALVKIFAAIAEESLRSLGQGVVRVPGCSRRDQRELSEGSGHRHTRSGPKARQESVKRILAMNRPIPGSYQR